MIRPQLSLLTLALKCSIFPQPKLKDHFMLLLPVFHRNFCFDVYAVEIFTPYLAILVEVEALLILQCTVKQCNCNFNTE